MTKVRTREEIEKKCEKDLTVLFWQWDEDMSEVQCKYAKAIWNEIEDPLSPAYKAYSEAIAPIQKRYEANIKRIEAKRDAALALLEYRNAQIRAQSQQEYGSNSERVCNSTVDFCGSNGQYNRG